VSLRLPPIDAHAHVETGVPSRDLADLGAFVFAVTRSRAEWDAALRRSDVLSVWGLGVHPGVTAAIEGFDPDDFQTALQGAVLVGEVGLDGKSKVAMTAQRAVFDEVLLAVQDQPRPVSIHSVRASAAVLDALRRRPVVAPILHWWRGNQKETAEAVEMGCFFSLNGAEVARPRVIDLLPPDRVLTETDFPNTRRTDRRAIRPAATATIESALAERWSLSEIDLRRRLWQTVGVVMAQCNIDDRLPPQAQDVLLTVGDAFAA
jgi:TatD DNase family protein